MEQVPRQFESVPVCAEDTRFSRIDVGDEEIKDASRPQPLGDPGDHFIRLVKMLEDIDASDDVEGVLGRTRLRGCRR